MNDPTNSNVTISTASPLHKKFKLMTGGHRGRIAQVPIYLGKDFRMFIFQNDWKVLPMSALIAGMIAIVVGENMYVTMEGQFQCSLALTFICIWNGFFNSIQSVCRERPIIKREHRTGLHISSFVIAHVIFEFLQCAAEAVIITLVVCVKYWDNLPEEGIFMPVVLELYITFLLVMFCSDILGVMVSSIVPNEGWAMTVMPFILIIQLVMSGAVFPLEGLSKKVSSLTVSRWGLDAIGSIAYINESVEDSIRVQEQMTQTTIELDHWDPTVSNIFFLWGLMVLFIAVYTLIGILFLEGIDRDKR